MKTMKKIINSTVFAFFIFLSSTIYAESDSVLLYDANEDDTVFAYMRETQLLVGLVSAKQEKFQGPELPYLGLFSQLFKKNVELSEGELDLAEKKGQPLDLDYKADITLGLDTVVREIRDTFRNYPATGLLVEMSAVVLCESERILKELSVDEGLEHDKVTPDELNKLLGKAIDNEIKKYLAFVEKHKNVLDKIAALANNKFKVTVEPKQYRTLKEFFTGKEEREIRALSEIMPYINSLDEAEGARNDF